MIYRNLIVTGLLSMSLSMMGASKPRVINLVPDAPSICPDYFCTWNIQGYSVSYQHGSERMREAMNEQNIFGHGPAQNWVNFFPEIRSDIFFVLDDSWDIPADRNNKHDNPDIGMLQLDESRFPSFTGTPAERFRKLSDKLKSYGWKGLGLWCAAQKAPKCRDVGDEDYWDDRLKTAAAGDVGYWKVDWGQQDRDDNFRRMLSDKARKLAPNLCLENAMKEKYIEFSDAFRTYDVENIISQPVTIARVTSLLKYKHHKDVRGLINCEDEPYIAAGLGCAIGIMRHPYVGPLPNGAPDHTFPSTVRDLKNRLDEVVRGVRWHRIATAYGVDGNYNVDEVKLEDQWIYRPNESWAHHEPGEVIKASAPARVSRNMPLPIVRSEAEDRPYVLSTRYPNGATAVSAIGRTLGRKYVSCEVDVEIAGGRWDAPIGIFGFFKSLTVNFQQPVPEGGICVYAQDLKSDRAVDVTSEVQLSSNKLVVPSSVIRSVGLMFASPRDVSAPGLVVKIVRQ
ncbi:MAG: hypothetical protein ACOYJK_01570 [Prevotella sp.]|jgi:hypothetical protein